MKTKGVFLLSFCSVREQEEVVNGRWRNGRVRERRGSELPPVQRLGKNCGAKAAALRGLGEELRKRERPGDRLEFDESPSGLRVNMVQGSMGSYYCQ